MQNSWTKREGTACVHGKCKCKDEGRAEKWTLLDIETVPLASVVRAAQSRLAFALS